MNADINYNQRINNYKKGYQVKINKQTKAIADKLNINYPEFNLSDIDSQSNEDIGYLALHNKILEYINGKIDFEIQSINSELV
tara:strand:+ start:8085 stop:8333 length:249 start_codon:yes stop_codon:yes gene_type:complete